MQYRLYGHATKDSTGLQEQRPPLQGSRYACNLSQLFFNCTCVCWVYILPPTLSMNHQDALMAYGRKHNGMSEYEAYFSFLWQRHRDRAVPAFTPWVLRDPRLCDHRNKTMLSHVSGREALGCVACQWEGAPGMA